jgi:hypothetical protein
LGTSFEYRRQLESLKVPSVYTTEFLSRVRVIHSRQLLEASKLATGGAQLFLGGTAGPAFIMLAVGRTRDSARTYLNGRFGATIGTRILNLIPMGHDEKPRSTPISKSVRGRPR